jgi:hypothetical protein
VAAAALITCGTTDAELLLVSQVASGCEAIVSIAAASAVWPSALS